VAHAQGKGVRAALYIALAAALLGAIALPALAAESRPLLTIADGPVQVLRGAIKFDAAEGLALADDDIVRTTAATRVARIEFGDGRVLDLGPSTQVLLPSPRIAQAQGWPGASAVVAQGWAKLSAGAAAARLVTPHLVAVSDARGAVLTHSLADGAALAFAEARGLALLPRAGDSAEVLLREGESWTRSAAGAVRVSSRATGLTDMPRALADTLPRRAALFDGAAREPGEATPIEASDLAAWSVAEPKLMALLLPSNTAAKPAARSGGNRIASAARAKPRRVARVLPQPAAAVTTAATQMALPPTIFLNPEPVATVHLPALPGHARNP
jgi:hypothetical protein